MDSRITEELRREAIRIASIVLPIYLAAYPGDTALMAVLEQQKNVDIAYTIMVEACTRAETCPGRDQVHRLHRAADAAEAVWLALQPEPNLAEVIAATEAAMHLSDKRFV